MEVVMISCTPNAYDPMYAARGTFNIGDMIEWLEEMRESYGADTPIVLKFNEGYSYGAIEDFDLEMERIEE